ncbi:delta(24)-sterol reductase-like [Macrosteles quadrilineatus]|uniref:delta(24)-sterol reductase-like n=1 Tax=Macrosteles quadrilineatus TaxID=74068 RepID=UPI0023E25DFF|nr:delta(24)-sterol reductase-like [Macrosteles quadrilineatus]
MKVESIVEFVLFRFRWIFVCLFLLPCTITYDFLVLVKKLISSFSTKEVKEGHFERAKFVQDQVKQWHQGDQSTPMCTGRPGWKAMTLREPKYKQWMYNIQVDLDEIVEIDIDRQVMIVEPLVTMGQISASLIPLGWTLPLVVELDDLTVGGLIMGQGIESSSHAVGLFQHICLSYEIVLADGSMVRCSKDEDPDLFYAIPWSYGTLGFLTAVELRITPAKRFVKLKYEPFYSLDEGVAMCEARSKDKNKNQFVEGIMFDKNQGVIMTGSMVDDGTNVNAIGRWYKPWFYEHVRSFLTRGEMEECIPLRDYYHRHTKALFWELQDIVPFGNNLFFRWILGWAMPPKISFLKRTQTKVIKDLYDKHHVVQDLIIPIQLLKKSLLFFDKEINVYPIWLCPALLPNDPGLVHSYSDTPHLYVDIGLYGTPNAPHYECVQSTRAIEHFTIQNKGYQMMYAGTFCDEEEFSKMFDLSLYNRVRERLKCDKAFPHIFGKINRKVRN